MKKSGKAKLKYLERHAANQGLVIRDDEDDDDALPPILAQKGGEEKDGDADGSDGVARLDSDDDDDEGPAARLDSDDDDDDDGNGDGNGGAGKGQQREVRVDSDSDLDLDLDQVEEQANEDSDSDLDIDLDAVEKAADAGPLDGRGAGTVFRDKEGNVLDMQKELREQREYAKRRKEAEEAERIVWATGKKQREEARKKREQLKEAASAPFSRFEDDSKLDELRRREGRDGDPMAAYMEATGQAMSGEAGAGNGGSSAGKPQYRGPLPPPNRFGIRPGYRWDGVDRGNGFEQRLYSKGNAAKASEEDRYAFAVEDM